MAMIYGREADPDKVRADEIALREAMQNFVVQHHFVSRDPFAAEAQSPEKARAVEAARATAVKDATPKTGAAA